MPSEIFPDLHVSREDLEIYRLHSAREELLFDQSPAFEKQFTKADPQAIRTERPFPLITTALRGHTIQLGATKTSTNATQMPAQKWLRHQIEDLGYNTSMIALPLSKDT